MRALRNVSRFLKPYWFWALLAPLLMTLEVTMDLMQPRLVQQIIDQGIVHSNGALVIHTGLWMCCAALVGLVTGSGCTVFAVMAAQAFGADVRRALFEKIQSLSFGNLDKLETGSLITRLTNDVTQVQEMILLMLRIMVRVPLMLVGSLVMGILTCPQLAWLFLVLMPIVLVVLVIIMNRTYPLFKTVQARLDALNTVLQENLAGVRVVKAFARAVHEGERFSKANDSLMTQNILAVRASSVTMPFVMLILNAGLVAAIWVGGVKVVHHQMQVGQIVAFLNYLMQTLMSLMMVSMLVLRVSRAEASAQRIQEVLRSVPEVPAAPASSQQASLSGSIAFENVSFRYLADDQDPVLKDVSFVAQPGQTIALLGATGAGKTSLVNLIPRFYDVTEGRITFGGVDIREIPEEKLRAGIGVALQESVLFSGTIRDNIRYGRPDASDEEVTAAAHMAQAHDFIMNFPEGYDTVLGQRGVNLSGGQKQRLAIARALLPHPSVLILDDSTSAVDVETEASIQHALAAERAGRTCFVVAQRISTVLNADKILVLDDGRIAAEGTHFELLNSSPIYREIYESQMDAGKAAANGR